jgi:hypothetical protein
MKKSSGIIRSVLSEQLNNLPNLKLLFHDTGHATGTNTWASHVGGLVWTLSNTLSLKDADGVYASADQESVSVSGTMPTLQNYAVCFGVGRMVSGGTPLNAFTGLNTVIGDSIGRTINAYANTRVTTENCSCPAPSPNLTELNQRACVMGFVDLVSAADPLVYRVLANDAGESAYSIGAMNTGTNMTLMGNAALTSDLHFSPILLGATRPGSRGKMFGLFDFDESIPLSDLQEAAVYMANNYGKIWPGFFR